MTFLTRGCQISCLERMRTSAAQEYEFLSERPCGLVKKLFFMPMSQAKSFIDFTKFQTGYPSSASCLPKWYASVQAASFPLGSIIPQIRSMTEILSPSSRSAVVPIRTITSQTNCLFRHSGNLTLKARDLLVNANNDQQGHHLGEGGDFPPLQRMELANDGFRLNVVDEPRFCCDVELLTLGVLFHEGMSGPFFHNQMYGYGPQEFYFTQIPYLDREIGQIEDLHRFQTDLRHNRVSRTVQGIDSIRNKADLLQSQLYRSRRDDIRQGYDLADGLHYGRVGAVARGHQFWNNFQEQREWRRYNDWQALNVMQERLMDNEYLAWQRLPHLRRWI